MKKNLKIIYICLITGLFLNACSGMDKNIPESTKTVIEPAVTSEKLPGNEHESEADRVKVRDKVFEGRYFDESFYKYIDMPESESPLIYCEIIVSNVMDNSFNFTIYEKVMATGESEIIVPVGTAVFIEDDRAAYYGDEQTMYFTFHDEPDLYPKHMEVSGLERMEGKIYINNSIPGHESG